MRRAWSCRYANELVLHSNELSPNGVKFIVKQLQATLKMLDISNTVRPEERSKGDKKAGAKLKSDKAQAQADIAAQHIQAVAGALKGAAVATV